MSKKTMKDYVTGIQPINIKNIITISSKEKQSRIRKAHAKTKTSHNVQEILLSERSVSEYQIHKDFEESKKISSTNPSRKAKRSFVIERTIDLHGLMKAEALETLLRFFENCQSQNIRKVLVITGGSAQRNSVIRSSFTRWIVEYFQKYVSSYGVARTQHGGEGAFYVMLKISK